MSEVSFQDLLSGKGRKWYNDGKVGLLTYLAGLGLVL